MVTPTPGEQWSVRRHWQQFADGIRSDVAAFDPARPRGRQAAACGLAVAAAVGAAILLDLDYPMWAGMSAFTCLQVSAAATELKALVRIAATIAGALFAALVIGFIADDHAALVIALFASVSYTLFRSYLSRYAYAWWLGGFTIGIVLLTTMADADTGLRAAAYRTAEVVLGVAAAWGASALLLPPSAGVAKDRALLAEPSLHSSRRALFAALEGGAGIVLVVILYDLFDLPGFASATLSITRIADPNPDVGRHRGFLRLIGCVVGAAAGLLMVGFAVEWLPVLLFWLFFWCTVFGYFGSGSPASSYAGLQAAFAFCVAYVPTTAPATTLEPAIDRLAGILLAMVAFWAIDVVVGACDGEPDSGKRRG
jgi:uncharacterized membrane protein YccC